MVHFDTFEAGVIRQQPPCVRARILLHGLLSFGSFPLDASLNQPAFAFARIRTPDQGAYSMDSLDSTSFDSGSSAATPGGDPGSSSDATSPDAQASWGEAMANAGPGGDANADDMGWNNTSSPWDSSTTAAASAPSQDSTAVQSTEPSDRSSASDAQATAARSDAYAARASLDANAILRGMRDRKAAGSSADAVKSWQVADLSPTPATPPSADAGTSPDLQHTAEDGRTDPSSPAGSLLSSAAQYVQDHPRERAARLPVTIYSECEDEGWGIRKVEIFHDGQYAFTDKVEEEVEIS